MGRVRLPDFIIGGAPRSGTTWLYHLLERHPDVHMAQPVRPEPKFFLIDAEYARGLDYYSTRWFAGVDRSRAGEKSTDYLESAAAAERIAASLPDVRLVFILREPASRAVSNYAWSRMNGLEHLELAEALRQEPAREAAYPEAQRYSRPHSYFSRGLYADLLAPYLRLLSRERVLVLEYEDIEANPLRLAHGLWDFLEVEPRPADIDGLGIINPSEEYAADPAVMASLRRRYEGPNRDLEALLGQRFEAWGHTS